VIIQIAREHNADPESACSEDGFQKEVNMGEFVSGPVPAHSRSVIGTCRNPRRSGILAKSILHKVGVTVALLASFAAIGCSAQREFWHLPGGRFISTDANDDAEKKRAGAAVHKLERTREYAATANDVWEAVANSFESDKFHIERLVEVGGTIYAEAVYSPPAEALRAMVSCPVAPRIDYEDPVSVRFSVFLTPFSDGEGGRRTGRGTIMTIWAGELSVPADFPDLPHCNSTGLFEGNVHRKTRNYLRLLKAS